MVGISGMLLRKLMEEGYEAADKYMGELTLKLKILMLLTGSRRVEELKGSPIKVKGGIKRPIRIKDPY